MNTIYNRQIITFPIRSIETQLAEQFIKFKLVIPSKYFHKNNLDKKTNYIIHKSFQIQQTNERQGTANTRTRSEVRGGGKKPWKQKGTGRARAGSNRSPLWRGGGVSFGPKTRSYKQKINRREWRLSLRLLLLKKLNHIIVVDKFSTESYKTKNFISLIKSLKLICDQKIIIIVPFITINLQLAVQNLSQVKLMKASCLNFKEILLAKYVLLESKSLEILQQNYND